MTAAETIDAAIADDNGEMYERIQQRLGLDGSDAS